MESMDRRLRESAAAGDPSTDGQESAGSPEGREAPEGGQEAGDAGAEGSPEGRSGAPSEGGRAGEPGAEPTEARGTPGPPRGGATRGDPRRLSDEEVRQYAREFGQRNEQLRAVRDQLRRAGRPVEELQAVLDAMNRLEREGIWDNPAQVAGLNEEVLEMLKRLEFDLRREVEGEAERRATLTGSDEVPPGYRELVEEYYKALAREGGGG
jgi:hypothetical protein